MTFSSTLRRLREKAQLTQAGLADRAGLSLRTIQSWEQGRRAPVSPDFFKLADALGVRADAFRDGRSGREDAPPAKGTTQKPRGRPRKGQ
jgi:transcriptional regulator with XRE-family HTH domain